VHPFFSIQVPKTVGRYSVKAVVTENENYDGLESEVLSFVLEPLTVVGLRVSELPKKTAYVAFESFVPDGLVIEATYVDGSVNTVENQRLTFSYREENRFLYGDTRVTASFGGASVSIPISVYKAKYNMAEISFEDNTSLYNGTFQTLVLSNSLPVGLDGYPLLACVLGGGVHVGTYTLCVEFSTQSENYEIPKNLYATLSILPLSLAVVWDDSPLTYSGTLQFPKAMCIGVLGEELPYVLSGGGVNAGEYEVSLSLLTSDYTVSNPIHSYTVSKAVFDMSNVAPLSCSFVYDGEEKITTLCGLPPKINVCGYVNAVGTNAGIYHASASFSYDTLNYEDVAPLTWDWEITPAAYDMSSVVFDTSAVVYDGNPHTPSFIGTLPTGVDGSVLTFSFESALTHAGDAQTVLAVFHTSSLNYQTPSPISLSMTVLPLPITVTWGETSFQYDGTAHTPTACAALDLTVEGGGIYAGDYTARAVCQNPDYVIENDRIEYRINKAKNGWLIPFSVDDFYEDGKVSYLGTPKKGEMTVSFYIDADCQNPVTELTHGTYFAKATVSELRNYEALQSDVVMFEIIEVLPVSIFATQKNGPLHGGTRLVENDVEIVLVYNSGKEEKLSLYDVAVGYPSGDFLTVNDITVVFSYQSFSYEMPVTVMKSVVSVPSFSLAYSGESQRPTVSIDAPYVIDGGDLAVSVGEYSVMLRIKDPVNYAFEGSDRTTITVPFWIVPRALTVKIGDVLRYRDGKYENAGYEILSGTLAPGDALEISYEITDRVSAKIIGENYDITIIEGQVKETGELSKEGKKKALFFTSIIGAFLFFAGVLLLLCKPLADKPEYEPQKLPSAKSFFSFGESTDNRSSALTLRHAGMPLRSEEIMKDILASVDEQHADTLISDSFAKHLLGKKKEKISTFGKRKCILNLDTIHAHFENGSRVDINLLKAKGLLPYDCGYFKVLARGSVGKRLTIYADDFSLKAVKMIALTGGVAIRVHTFSKKLTGI